MRQQISVSLICHCYFAHFNPFAFYLEAKEQVTANLANFAYDPINYTYLKSASAVELFIELISSANPVLVRHGVAGICNLCLGKITYLKIPVFIKQLYLNNFSLF